MSLLTHWLCSFVSISEKTPQYVFEHFIRGIAIEPTNIRLTTQGIYLNERMFVGKKHFTADEFALFERKDYYDTRNTFKFNYLFLTDEHRALLMRDFVSVCLYLQNRCKRHYFPMYALLVIQKLIFVEGHYIPCLMHAEHTLQGLGGKRDK